MSTEPVNNAPDFSLIIELRQYFSHIVGLDEVGRGALAGPVVVGAVELDAFLPDIKDSKVLSANQRQRSAQEIVANASQIAIGLASNQEVDELGIQKAQQLAYERALGQINADVILLDYVDFPSASPRIRAVHGETLFFPVAAASIVAKAYRDQLMRCYSRFFPEYNWQSNVGYGTHQHREAIHKHGPTALHRKSFLS